MNYFMLVCRLILLFVGCGAHKNDSSPGTLGGEDTITINLPFSAGYESLCTQGVDGAYSHHYTCTYYDLDLDTPNNEDDLIFAPAGGTAYVHDADPNHNFGNHVNIDLGDDTYIIIAHMKEIFIADGDEVATGQLLGFEGATGAAAGDHVHMGRHRGDAWLDGIYGESLEGLQISMTDESAGGLADDFFVDDVTCDLSYGHVYRSELLTALSHPSGTLVKTPYSSTVYLVDGDNVEPFLNETAFTGHNYSFGDVVLISEEELGCYSVGESIDSSTTLDDSAYRDGTLVSPEEASDVYVMENGYAMPVDSWETYLFMGFLHRTVQEVPEDELNSHLTGKGDCSANTGCITKNTITLCGGSYANESSVQAGSAGDAGGDEAGDSDDSDVGGETLTLSWSTPSLLTASTISLSGEYVDALGNSSGWVNSLVTATNATGVTYVWSGVQSGDSFRFSVEYTVNGVTSWSCLAPYPPGTVQGTSAASVNSESVSVNAVPDPSSSGCGLQVFVP